MTNLSPVLSSEAEAHLEAAGKVELAGELEIDATAELKTGDKFVIAKYTEVSGEFSKISVKGNAAAMAGGRKREMTSGDWTCTAGDTEYTCEYTGAGQAMVPTPAPTALAAEPDVANSEDDDEPADGEPMMATPDSASSAVLSFAAAALALFFT